MKHIKMLLYGEPGVGKSVFASKAPRPFFITTDGNYEWLEDFGAKPEDHIQVSSWDEAKKAFKENYDKYDTIVVDLIEDLFKWCEQEFCIRSKIDHVSDIGYGKGYDITRNEFFLEISKLLGKPKNVILISHGITFTVKDRRGVDHTKYAPSSRLPDKVLDMIEGRLRYCLRCYLKAEEVGDGELVKKRYLSLVPKENEFGIIRGVDDTKVPHDIPLDWKEFEKTIGFDQNKVETEKEEVEEIQTKKIVQPVIEEVKEEPIKEEIKLPMEEDTLTREEESAKEVVEEVKEEIKAEPVKEEVNSQLNGENLAYNKREEESQENTKPQTNMDKLAAIKAKLEALKNKKEGN